MRRPALVALATVALAGCDSFYVNSATGVVIIGFVGDVSGLVVIQAPDTVRAGVPFDAVVNTFGSSSCVTPVRADVEVTGLVARVTPYDRVDRAGPCTDDLATRPHPVRLTFKQAGAGVIEAHGRVGGLDAARDTVVRHPLVILP